MLALSSQTSRQICLHFSEFVALMTIYQTLFINVGVAVGLPVLICGREGNQTLLDFFERDARISTPHRVNVNSGQGAVQELLGS
jgi:hypothetical protein